MVPFLKTGDLGGLKLGTTTAELVKFLGPLPDLIDYGYCHLYSFSEWLNIRLKDDVVRCISLDLVPSGSKAPLHPLVVSGELALDLDYFEHAADDDVLCEFMGLSGIQYTEVRDGERWNDECITWTTEAGVVLTFWYTDCSSGLESIEHSSLFE